MLVCCMRYWSVRAKETELDMFVRERNTSKESSLGGVSIPVIDMMAPLVADNHHLAADGWRVRWASFGDRCL